MTSDTPSSGFPADEPTPEPHRGPVHDTRPRSPWAVWTLVVTILFALAAMTSGVWAAMIPALILGAISLNRIKPRVKRGQVMVLVAMLVAAMAGSCSFMNAKTWRDMVDHLGSGALGSLGSDEPARIDKWIASESREGGAAETFQKRFAAVVEAYGPYQGEVIMPSAWFGVLGLMAPHTDVEEIGADAENPWTLRQGALWFRARFRDAVVHVEIYLGDNVFEEMKQALQDAQSNVPSQVLWDLRFFRDK